MGIRFMVYENYLEKYIVRFVYVTCNIRKIFLSQYYFNILVRYIYLYICIFILISNFIIKLSPQLFEVHERFQ